MVHHLGPRSEQTTVPTTEMVRRWEDPMASLIPSAHYWDESMEMMRASYLVGQTDSSKMTVQPTDPGLVSPILSVHCSECLTAWNSAIQWADLFWADLYLDRLGL